jgi:hypothetical protein
MGNAAPWSAPMPSSPIDTLGKLLAAGFEMFGSCADCASRYRKDIPVAQRQLSTFPIDLRALIVELGADHTSIGKTPVRCPYCGSWDTSTFIVPITKERPRGGA